MNYTVVMATTTVRLDPGEEHALDVLAQVYGGRSNALREGLRRLAQAERKREELAALLAEWQGEFGAVGEAAINDMTKRFGL